MNTGVFFQAGKTGVNDSVLINRSKPLPVRIVLLQAVIGLGMAITFLIAGWEQAFSSLLATIVVVIPNVLFVRAVFSPRRKVSVGSATVHQAGKDREAGQNEGAAVFAGVAWRHILARQAGKVLATLVLMVGAFIFFRPQALGFFTAIVAMQSAYVLVPLGSGVKGG